MLEAILLTVLACVAMFDALGPKTLMLTRPLLSGVLFNSPSMVAYASVL